MTTTAAAPRSPYAQSVEAPPKPSVLQTRKRMLARRRQENATAPDQPDPEPEPADQLEPYRQLARGLGDTFGTLNNLEADLAWR